VSPPAVATREITEPAAIAEGRAVVRRVAAAVDPELVEIAALVASELMTNAVLHGGGRGLLEVTEVAGGRVRIGVTDFERRVPLVGVASESSMTGRGMALIGQLAAAWGVRPLVDGKEVWAEVAVGVTFDAAPGDLIARWDDDDDAWDAVHAVPKYTVTLGDVPTDLLIRAKSHVDNLVREFMLTSGGAVAGTTASVPANLAELIDTVVHDFVDARDAIKRQAVEAHNSGLDHAHLELHLPASAAEAGEAYLGALDEADAYCRAMRLLTLETPPEHRVFRRWYVGEIVRQLREAARGETPAPPVSFEQCLLAEIASVAAAHRRSERAARLYDVSVLLTSAATADDVARVVLEVGCAGLGASGVAVLLPGTGNSLSVVGTVGYPDVVVERLRREARDAGLPAAHALRTGEAVWIESRDDLDASFPDLRGMEEDTMSMCAVPLEVAGRRLGVLRLSFGVPRLFDDEDRRFLVALAAQCAQALDRTQLEQSRDELRRGTVSGADAVASLEELFQALPALVAYLEGPSHVFRFVNRSYQELLPGRQLIGRIVTDALPEAVGLGFLAVLDRVWATGEAVTGREVPVQVPRRDGSAFERFVDFTFQPIRRAGGAIEGVLVHAVDVSEDVAARQALEAAAQDRFRLAVDSMLDPVVMCRPVLDERDGTVIDLRVDYANPAAIPDGALPVVGHLLSEAWQGIREEGLLQRYLDVAATGQPLVLDDYRYRDPRGRTDGGVFDIRATRVGEVVFVVYRDVTWRAERERELVHHREALAEAQRIAKVGSWSWDARSGESRWSDELFAICDLDPGTTSSGIEALLGLLGPGAAEVRAALEGAARTGVGFQLEKRLTLPSGLARTIVITGEAEAKDGAVVATRGTIQDVTEQRRVERALRDSEARRQEEHDAVQVLQAAILPSELPALAHTKLVARYVGASENVGVGGDFYDVFAVEDDLVLLTVGDVAGKGVQAAEAVGQLRNGLRMAAVIEPDPDRLVERLNLLIERGFKAPFATAVVAVYRPSSGEVCWTSAGHLPVVLRRADGSAELLGDAPTHPPLGVSPLRLRDPWAVTLAAGDRLVLFTDGLVERRGEDLTVGLDRLLGTVRSCPDDPEAMIESVLGEAPGAGNRPDDVCVLVLART
jgi:serine phosphatase RsbU (regulator of sigma subunit)/GAF domain-containing protein/anti-sigma regulatory factor (Ser/Thr protein kinase)